jgi:hypothetical protein
MEKPIPSGYGLMVKFCVFLTTWLITTVIVEFYFHTKMPKVTYWHEFGYGIQKISKYDKN